MEVSLSGFWHAIWPNHQTRLPACIIISVLLRSRRLVAEGILFPGCLLVCVSVVIY